ncbi:MAG: radical SAM protein [Pseudomonadota bacterium]
MNKDTLKVIEIYQSIQGESSLTGIPCTFVRLAGCPLRCKWCDTVYSFEGGAFLTLAEIVAQVQALAPRTVELTGGEPLAQTQTNQLAEMFVAQGFKVMIETSGSEPIEFLPKETHIVMDVKCPGSGMSSKNKLGNLQHLKPTDDLKFVVASQEDFDWSCKFVQEHKLENKVNLLASPAFGHVDPKDLVTWILSAPVTFRLNLQIHKYIWGPRVKGV